MKALISPMQDNVVAEVSADANIFEVAEPLFWVDCPDTTVAYQYEYVNGTIVKIPVPEVTAEQNKATATSLLQATDWVNQPDVRNTANTPHLLNSAEFDTYRLAVRQYAVNPVAGDINWPTLPAEQWSN
jgi:hypothetical protein